jgi:hypothetical protein
MVFDGHEPDPVGMTFTAGKERGSGAFRKVIETFTWEDWRGPWDPQARLSDMDLDGVKMETLYPSMARNFYSLKGEETPLQKAGLQSYNSGFVITVPRRQTASLVWVCSRRSMSSGRCRKWRAAPSSV